MKKSILGILLFSGLLLANGQTMRVGKAELQKFSLAEQNLASSETKLQEIEMLKENKAHITKIITDLTDLSEEMRGYEERETVLILLKHFKAKYLIQETDMLNIKNNLNEARRAAKELKEKNKPKEVEPGIFGASHD